MRDLLSHRSGLGLGAGDLLWWPTTTFSTDEIIEKLRYIRPATSFRNNYAYDNLLYIVAGKIIADKAGKPWGAAIRARILAPLGMTATTTSLEENAGNANVANAHKLADEIGNGVVARHQNDARVFVSRWGATRQDAIALLVAGFDHVRLPECCNAKIGAQNFGVNAENGLARLFFQAYGSCMELAIRDIIDALGGPGNAAKAAVSKGIPLKRQTVEYWYDEGRFPIWRTPDVKALAAMVNPPKARKRAKAA